MDLAVIGAGPVGLAVALEAKRRGISVQNLERGTLLHTIYRWPKETIFFSEAKNLEIGGHPMPSLYPKPTRREALAYYRRVAELEGLDIQTYTEVQRLEALSPGFRIHYQNRSGLGNTRARFVVLATGYYDQPNRLGIPGEDLPHVHYGIEETLPYWQQKVLVVGGSNSAIETALDLYRSGAQVTVVHREAEVRPSVKYWLKPDFENRVKEGSIGLLLNTSVQQIKARSAVLQRPEGRLEVETDFVVVLIGYRAVDDLLHQAGAVFGSQQQPLISDSYETSVAGLFVAGSAGFGLDTRTVFIENGREHAKVCVEAIAQRLQG